jgi:ribosome-associated protein
MQDDEELIYEQEEPEGPSRSELKRQAQDRQTLIGKLLDLAPSEWVRLGFDEADQKILKEGKRLKLGTPRNRYVKFLAKRLDDDALNAGAAFLENRHSHQLETNRAFHALERWRDRLIAEGDDAMGALLGEHPDLDRQQLRTLIRGARKERDTGKPAGAAKKLFRYLRDATGH